MSEFYDRQGKRLALLVWARMLDDREYAGVAYDEIGPFRVSTVWLGINYNFSGEGPPLTFETMIFDTRIKVQTVLREEPYDESVECWRYPTEEAALAGHDQAVMWAREQVSV